MKRLYTLSQETDEISDGDIGVVPVTERRCSAAFSVPSERVRQSSQPHVMTKATSFVDRARAETLFQFDEQDAAIAIIAPYASGVKV
jgi:hypothetical protein